jgi:replication factor A1
MQTAHQTVTVDCLSKLLGGAEILQCALPVVQVLSKQTLVPRFSIRISDSIQYIDAIFSSGLDSMVENIVDLSFLKLSEISISLINNQKKLLIIQMKIIGVGNSIIGSPSHWKSEWTPPKIQHFSHNNNNNNNNNNNQNYNNNGNNNNNCLNHNKNGAFSPIKPLYAQFENPKGLMQGGPNGILNKITPISDVNSSMSKFTLKARVTCKGEMKGWKNNNGAGCLFNLDLVDSSGEIHCTFYNDAASLYQEMLQVGKVYYFYHGRVKQGGKFNPKKHAFEMTFYLGCEVIPCVDAVSENEVPLSLDIFKKISDVESISENCQFDIIVALKTVSELHPVMLKKEGVIKNIPKRDIMCIDNSGPDDTGLMMSLVLWGNTAEKFLFQVGDIIVIRNIRATNFNGKSLTACGNTQFSQDDTLTATNRLREWMRVEHPVQSIQGLTLYPTMTIEKARELLAADQNRNVYFQTEGTIMSIKHDLTAPICYNACCNLDCLKKVVHDPVSNMWICEKCNQSHNNPNIRYILSLIIADKSGSLWANVFNEVGEQILGRPASAIQSLKAENNEPDINTIFEGSVWKSWIMKLKLFNSFYQDEYFTRTNIIHLEPVDYLEESKKLLVQLQNEIS